MERGEPTFVPEWLKNVGSVNGGGSSTHHFSDVPSLANPTRNRSFKSISDFDGPRSVILERSASPNSGRNSNNNGSSAKHPYSSFGRSHRDKDRDREKERSVGGSRWDFDPLDDMLTGRTRKDTLRPSRSMVSGKQSDFKNGIGINHHNGNGAISMGGIGSSSLKKSVFDKDFPSLGTEDIGRVPSPGLASAIQSLPIGNSALMVGEGWSALAEVPVIMGSNGVGSQSTHQSTAATTAPVTVATGTVAGLNMAEALAQAPTRARTVPQAFVETQRLEELAIKKSRQLVPMTPSMPKVLMLNSSDKLKPKTPIRNSEMIVGPKNGNASQPIRGVQLKSEPLRTSSHAGKFQVLKPMREIGVSNVSKDSPCPTNNSNSIVGNSPLAVQLVSSVPRSPNNPKLPDRKSTPLPLNLGLAAEKRPLSQAKSRSDFFNSMRKKSSADTSSVLLEDEKSGEVMKDDVAASDSVSPHVIENGEVVSNGDASEEGENDSSPNAVYPDEEEAAFLRSLGWDENDGGEDEGGLTEEEINAFYQEFLALRPSLKICRSLQPKLSMLSETYAGNMSGAEVSSSGFEA